MFPWRPNDYDTIYFTIDLTVCAYVNCDIKAKQTNGRVFG